MRDDVRGLHMCCGHNCITLYLFVHLPFSNFCYVFALSPNMYGLKEKREGEWRGVDGDCGGAVRWSRECLGCRSIGARAPR